MAYHFCRPESINVLTADVKILAYRLYVLSCASQAAPLTLACGDYTNLLRFWVYTILRRTFKAF